MSRHRFRCEFMPFAMPKEKFDRTVAPGHKPKQNKYIQQFECKQNLMQTVPLVTCSECARPPTKMKPKR